MSLEADDDFANTFLLTCAFVSVVGSSICAMSFSGGDHWPVTDGILDQRPIGNNAMKAEG